jgi:integrase
MARTEAAFADAAADWLRNVEHERGCSASALADYRSVVNAHLLPAFGNKLLERIDTQRIERRLCRLERLTISMRTDIAFYSPEEVHALVRAPVDEQDALFLAATLTGLRMGSCSPLAAPVLDRPRRSRVRWPGRRVSGRLGAATRLQEGPMMWPGCARCASTTYGTRSQASPSAPLMRKLQEWLGHPDFSTTTQIYIPQAAGGRCAQAIGRVRESGESDRSRRDELEALAKP